MILNHNNKPKSKSTSYGNEGIYVPSCGQSQGEYLGNNWEIPYSY